MGSRDLLVKILPLSWNEGCHHCFRASGAWAGQAVQGRVSDIPSCLSWVLHIFFPLPGILCPDFFWLMNSYSSCNAQVSITSREPFLTCSPDQVAHTGFPLLPDCLNAGAAITKCYSVVPYTTEMYSLTVLEAVSLRLS